MFLRIEKKNKNVIFEASALEYNSIHLWHYSFDYINFDAIIRTSRNKSVTSVLPLKYSKSFCKRCQLNKQRMVPFKPIKYIESRQLLERIYSDAWGPISISGQMSKNAFCKLSTATQDIQWFTHLYIKHKFLTSFKDILHGLSNP